MSPDPPACDRGHEPPAFEIAIRVDLAPALPAVVIADLSRKTDIGALVGRGRRVAG